MSLASGSHECHSHLQVVSAGTALQVVEVVYCGERLSVIPAPSLLPELSVSLPGSCPCHMYQCALFLVFCGSSAVVGGRLCIPPVSLFSADLDDAQ